MSGLEMDEWEGCCRALKGGRALNFLRKKLLGMVQKAAVEKWCTGQTAEFRKE